MGSIFSGYSPFNKRPPLVEQYQRINATRCPICKRGTRHLYSRPDDGVYWKCRLCHGLKYKSQYAKSIENHPRRMAAIGLRVDSIQAGMLWREIQARWRNGGGLKAPTMPLDE